VLAIWLVLSVIGVLLVVFAMPAILIKPASDASQFANLTIIVFTAVAVPVALFVWVFLVYSLVVFRVKEKPTRDGPRLQPTVVTQIAWLSATGALCLFLLVWGLIGMYETSSAAPANPLTVRVTAQQWTFTYTYPQFGIETHTLVLPVNRAVRFQVTSKDVLHGFAIDQLGVRLDANPGVVQTLPFSTPTRTGDFQTRCVEFCGLYHSYMYTPVKVETARQFTAWVKAQGGTVKGPKA
jgi:cytochrome c oxidase subunit 2